MIEEIEFENNKRNICDDIDILKEKDSLNNLLLKDIGLPKIIENKLLECVNYLHNAESSQTNLLLIGCPSKYVIQILKAMANENNANFKLVEEVYLKQGDLGAILTNFAPGDFVYFRHYEALNLETKHILNQAISSSVLNITIGKGVATRNISVPLVNFNTIIAVDSISQIPSDMIDSFYEIIDFRKLDYEMRIMYISEFGKKYHLNFIQTVKESLAKKFTNDEQLKLQLFEIRNKAFATNTQNINEDFLNIEAEELPCFEKIDTMEGREFELFTGNLFRALGYSNVVVTQSTGDFSADVIAEKDDVKFAIQCKRYSAAVGVSAVQEVIASKSLHDCHVACVLTNNKIFPS